MAKQIMNEEELALYLGLQVAAVRRFRNQGMPARFLGSSENRDARYLLDEIVEWVRARPDFVQKKTRKKA